MTYVPTQYSGGQRPSPRARELAQRLEHTLQEFQSNYPDTKPRDIQQALRMAWVPRGSRPTTGARRALALSLVAGIFVAVGLLFFLTESGSLSGGAPPVAAIIGIVAAAVGLFAVVKRSRE